MLLKAANSHPNRVLNFLEQLFYDADLISQYSDSQLLSYEKSFVKGLSEAHAQKMIETFMQNAMLIIDSHFELRILILSTLSKLTNIQS